MLKISLQILLILGAITLCSCNSVLPKSMEVAHQQSDNYYRYLQTNKQDSLLALFSETFYAETDTAALLKAIDQIKNELGEIVFAEYLSVERNTAIENGKTEDRITTKYKVKYSSGAITSEEFKFYLNEKSFGKIDAFNTRGTD